MFSFDPKLRVAEKHANEKAFGQDLPKFPWIDPQNFGLLVAVS